MEVKGIDRRPEEVGLAGPPVVAPGPNDEVGLPVAVDILPGHLGTAVRICALAHEGGVGIAEGEGPSRSQGGPEEEVGDPGVGAREGGLGNREKSVSPRRVG